MKQIPYRMLVPLAVLMAILPLGAEPHLIEKVGMLRAGTLTRPLDIFDLLMHGGLLGVLALKAFMDLKVRALPPSEGADPK
jgi:hypothetical protein